MKKILLGFIGLVVALLIAVHLFGAWALASILEKGIGAPVQAGRLELSLLSSRLGLSGFKIQNPRGFKEKTLAEIREISLEYDLGDFFKGKVHLKKIRLDFGDITLERNGTKINLLELGAVKGITQAFTGGGGGQKSEAPKPRQPEREKPASAPKKPQQPMELLMDEVFVNIGKVRYVDSGVPTPLVKEYDLGVHNETFRNVTKISSLVKSISFLILRKVGLSVNGNLDLLAKSVGGEIQSTFDQLKKKFFNQ